MIVAVPDRSGGFGDFGDLPPNIQAGACIPWQDGQGYQTDPDGWAYQYGVPIGKKFCQNYDQPDILPTVLSVPGDVMAVINDLTRYGESLALDEQNAQDMCRQAQASSSFSNLDNLTNLIAQLGTLQTTAGGAWNWINDAWAKWQAIDAAAEGAYTRGNYANPAEYSQVIKGLQAMNHAPLAWNDIQAAIDCATGVLADTIGVMLTDFNNRYLVVERNATAVSSVFAAVDDFIAALHADASKVTLSADANQAIAGAAPYLQELTNLATQIGALFQQAQDWNTRATFGAANLMGPDDVRQAFEWMQTAQAPFIGAGDQAAGLAQEIHSRLDQTAKDLHAWIVQHPELGPSGADGGTAAPAKKHAGLWLGIGATGALALLIKKGILFG